jgi:hypothetical protein
VWPVCGRYTAGSFLDVGDRQHQEGAGRFRDDVVVENVDVYRNIDVNRNIDFYGNFDFYGNIDVDGNVIDAGNEFATPEFAAGHDGGFDGCDEANLTGQAARYPQLSEGV